MKAILEAHPLLSLSAMVCAIVVSLCVLHWVTTLDDEFRHEMDDAPKGGR